MPSSFSQCQQLPLDGVRSENRGSKCASPIVDAAMMFTLLRRRTTRSRPAERLKKPGHCAAQSIPPPPLGSFSLFLVVSQVELVIERSIPLGRSLIQPSSKSIAWRNRSGLRNLMIARVHLAACQSDEQLRVEAATGRISLLLICCSIFALFLWSIVQQLS